MENQDWQPIETAPKDQVIIAYDPKHFAIGEGDSQIPVVAYWKWTPPVIGNSHWITAHQGHKIHPTHWKPATCPKVGE